MKIKFYACLCSLAGLLALSSCNNDDDTTPVKDPLFGVGGFSFTQTGPLGLLSTVASLDEGTTDLTQALEVPGGGLFASDGNGNIFVARGDAPNMIKFTVDEEDNFVEGETVSFANAGLPGLFGFSDQIQFISDTKAYFIDAAVTQQVIIWNPSDMTFTSSFPITGLPSVSEGGSLRFNTIIQSGNQVLIVVRYNDAEDLAENRLAVVFINTDSDGFTVDAVETCGGISGFTIAQNGDIYLASSNVAAVERAFGLDGSFDPCWVRISAGTNEIDDSFSFNPNSLTGSALTAGLVQGPNNSAYIQAYDETVSPLDLTGVPRDVQQTAAWRLWKIEDITNPTSATLVESLSPAAGGTFSLLVDGQTYLVSLSQDFSSSTLINITDENNISEGLQVQFAAQSAFSLN